MKLILKKLWYQAPLAILATLFLVACLKAYVRIETTVIGYRIGQLKQSESELLETQSTLKMDLARLTTRQNLMQISKGGENNEGWAAH